MTYTRFYRIADITIQVQSDLPITDETFEEKFKIFEVSEPGEDVVRIHHHFALPDLKIRDLGTEVYRRPPWAIYRKEDAWTYLGIFPKPVERLWCVATFDRDHNRGEIYRPGGEAFQEGNWHSLTLFPTDQMLLARVLAERRGCYLHSSGLILNRQGLLFVGHSEAGKSTTVKLLRDQGEVLCDDRNIVRQRPDGFRVYGSWSHGEVPAVSSASAPLRAVLFLEKAADNRLIPLDNHQEVLHRLLSFVIKPLVSLDWWDKTLVVLEQLSIQVPCYIMRFDKSGEVVPLLQDLCRAPVIVMQ